MTNENNQDKTKNIEIVIWDDKYATGIDVIDAQHRHLLELTNNLFNACVTRDNKLQAVFRDVMANMVKYVHFHFDAELKLLKAVNYPDYHDHKIKHDTLIRDILAAVKEDNEGKHFVPNRFVRTLKDWVFSHIAINDKEYSIFVHEQIKKGVLTEKKLKEIEMLIAQ